jgi:hypothetical protein
MNIDLKQLQKLAKLCRSLGVTHIKNGDFELELSSNQPATRQRRSRKAVPIVEGDALDENFESDSLSPEDLMLWSSSNPVDSVIGDA